MRLILQFPLQFLNKASVRFILFFKTAQTDYLEYKGDNLTIFPFFSLGHWRETLPLTTEYFLQNVHGLRLLKS